VLPELEGLRARQNEASEAIGAAKRSGDDAAEPITAMREVAARVKEMQAHVATVEERIRAVLATVPNIPEDGAPAEDAVLREWGEAGRAGADHLELLGHLVDMEAGSRVARRALRLSQGPPPTTTTLTAS